MRIMSKDIMASKGIPSPDVGDALMLTFVEPVRVFAPTYEEKFFKTKMRQKELKKHGVTRKIVL